MTKDTYIFDLDGTIANIDARRKLCDKGNGKLDWKMFFDPENISLDLPNFPVIHTLQTLHKAGFKIVIFSGRSKLTKEATVKWLNKFEVPFHVLKMRPTNTAGSVQPPNMKFEFMPDDDLKKMWLDKIFPGDEVNRIISVFDDRDKVVRMWRANNLPCFQVAPGNF